MLAGTQLRQWVRNNRRSPPVRSLASYAEKFLRAWHNEDFYDFSQNGERHVLEIFARWCKSPDPVIWDVGAHDGAWAVIAHQLMPHASIHSFEIIPDIFERLERKLGNQPWAKIYREGLSDEERVIDVTYNIDHPTTSAIRPRSESYLFQQNTKVVSCKITTVDRLVESGAPSPQFLKIDVEGHDAPVIRGAGKLLRSSSRPHMLQFEYGNTWIPERETLRDVVQFLGDAGYRVGRVHPNFVSFKDYKPHDDHFRMGNYVAVQEGELFRMLS